MSNTGAWTESLSVTVSAVTKYYYHGGTRVAMRQGDVVYYLHGDHLGSSSLTTDEALTPIAEARYRPYGEERWAAGGAVSDYTFTGQRKDSFGLMDYRARHYDPYLGRFISADTLVPGFANPQALNRYAYTLGNPLQFVDSTGHQGEPWWERVVRELGQQLNDFLVPEHDASVLSLSLTAGMAAVGVGSVGHASLDVVSNEKGQVQVFFTRNTNYLGALVGGDEEVLEFSQDRLEGPIPLIPQDDVTVFPQATLGASYGHANGLDLSQDVQMWGGLADVFRQYRKTCYVLDRRGSHGTLALSYPRRASHENPPRILPEETDCVHL